ncbi:hypothetical protein FA13DRAFT_1822475 [Coprinellus micaceus]|uniref:Uncharacterized protein n=1 Tax=Coprinellus micaceus TaxID=71717 RepID=A0A4Y7S827_COPMI|nr:hypothetical protein FA13DRAFT_1822475 [Coprinellus micaceus]
MLIATQHTRKAPRRSSTLFLYHLPPPPQVQVANLFLLSPKSSFDASDDNGRYRAVIENNPRIEHRIQQGREQSLFFSTDLSALHLPSQSTQAALALTDCVLKDGLQSLVSLQTNVKLVTRILYEDGRARQPYASRTLAHISFQLCNAVAKVNKDLAQKLCHALVAEAFTGMRVAWIGSELFSEMNEEDQSNFLFRTNTVADLCALGLVTLEDFISILDYIILKVKSADLFQIMLFEFVSRGLTHSALKLPWASWGRIHRRIAMVPASGWEFSRPSYAETLKVLDMFDEDAGGTQPTCNIPFKETVSSGGWMDLDTLCENIACEAAGSKDQAEDSLCPLEKVAWKLSRVILQAYIGELEAAKESPLDADVDPFCVGGPLASAIDDVMELICSQLFVGGSLNAEAMAELCATIYAELMSNCRPMGLPQVFKEVVRDTADLALFNSWRDVSGTVGGCSVRFQGMAPRRAEGPCAVELPSTPKEFRMFRNVASFFGGLHATGLTTHEYFDWAVETILEGYTAGTLDLLGVVIVDLICSGGVTAWDIRIDSRAHNWDTIRRQLADMEIDSDDSNNARWRLYDLVVAFYKMPACMGQLRCPSSQASTVRSGEWRDLEAICKELEQWADQRLIGARPS